MWAAAEAYSAPSIVLTSRSHDGFHVFDDFREAYGWLRHNTDVDDKVYLASYYYTICVYSDSYDIYFGRLHLGGTMVIRQLQWQTELLLWTIIHGITHT